MTQTYATATTSNHLSNIVEGGTTRSFGYNAIGQTTSDDRGARRTPPSPTTAAPALRPRR